MRSDDAIFHPIFWSNLLLTKIECDHSSQKSKANWIRKLKLLTVLLYLILLLIALKNFKNHINFANYIISIILLQFQDCNSSSLGFVLFVKKLKNILASLHLMHQVPSTEWPPNCGIRLRYVFSSNLFHTERNIHNLLNNHGYYQWLTSIQIF